jgi:hypothetical protein
MEGTPVFFIRLFLFCLTRRDSMFGISEEEMRETEKLADLYDRLRKYAREARVKVIVATAGVQCDVENTDLTVSWAPATPRIVDYLNIVRTKERPVSEKTHELSWDFTMPIGYSALRDGVTQEHDGTMDVAEGLALAAGSVSAFIKDTAEKYGLDPNMLERMVGMESGGFRRGDIPIVGLQHDHMVDRDVEFLYQGTMQPLIVTGGRRPGVREALSRLASQHEFRSIPGFDADFDGQVHGPKRYISKRHYWGEGADTPESAARKRRQSDVKPNGRKKKGWER